MLQGSSLKVALDNAVEAPASCQGLGRRVPIMYGSDSGLSDLHTVSMHHSGCSGASCVYTRCFEMLTNLVGL